MKKSMVICSWVNTPARLKIIYVLSTFFRWYIKGCPLGVFCGQSFFVRSYIFGALREVEELRQTERARCANAFENHPLSGLDNSLDDVSGFVLFRKKSWRNTDGISRGYLPRCRRWAVCRQYTSDLLATQRPSCPWGCPCRRDNHTHNLTEAVCPRRGFENRSKI